VQWSGALEGRQFGGVKQSRRLAAEDAEPLRHAALTARYVLGQC
jgi:hypothetical protein